LKILTNKNGKTNSAPRGIGLGFFDGVHIGHKELIQTLLHECQIHGCRPAIYTFTEHPGAVLQQETPFSDYISTLDDRLDLLHSLGVSEICLQNFDAEYAAIEPETFLDSVLADSLGTSLIVVGPDYRFGRGARGDVELLQNWAAGKGIRVVVVPKIELFGERVSSTAIRKAIYEGELPLAASLLGRPFSVSGKVKRGKGLGHTLGFPTANISIPTGLVQPAYGVYASRTIINGRTYESVTNFGVRPTIHQGETQPLIETCLLDVDVELYECDIEVQFLERMRPELKFDSVLEMTNQIHLDLEDARHWHRDAEQPYVVLNQRNAGLNLIRTRRFVQAGAAFSFRLPMSASRNARIALLLRVLTSGCRRLPDRKSLALALDAMYGSSIDNHVERQGDILAATLSCDGISRWSDGSSPFSETVDLLFEILLDPLRSADGNFDARIVATERQNLLMEIHARENDRAQYAFDQGLAVFCGGQTHGLPATGRAEDVMAVTDADLQTAYKELLETAELNLDLGGDIDAELLAHVIDLMAKLPDSSERVVLVPGLAPTPFVVEQQQDVTEERDVEQARVVLFFDGMPPYSSLASYTSAVLNSVLGGDAHSLLFETVREQMGLAYSVFSVPLRYLSSLTVMAGVSPDQVEAAVEAMKAQVERIREGNYDPRIFASALTMVEHSIRSRGDDLSRMLQQLPRSRVTGSSRSVSDSLALLATVTPEQVAQLAGRLHLRTCYILTKHAAAEPQASSGPAAEKTI